MEFWNDEVTERSWQQLIALRKKINFMLIGGWAVYLYTKLQKSRDIDVVVSYETLRKLSSEYALSKNDRLRKYEIKLDGFDIDIYLPGYSSLSLPVKDLVNKFGNSVEGFTLPAPEVLMALKIGAAMERKDSIKGGKDMIDVLGLLFFADVDLKQFKKLTIEYELKEYCRFLLSTLNSFDTKMVSYLNLNPKTFSEKKRIWVARIKGIL